MFCITSGAHSRSISQIWSGTHPGFENRVLFFSYNLAYHQFLNLQYSINCFSNYLLSWPAMAGHGWPCMALQLQQ